MIRDKMKKEHSNKKANGLKKDQKDQVDLKDIVERKKLQNKILKKIIDEVIDVRKKSNNE